jgi:hypothetical protein
MRKPVHSVICKTFQGTRLDGHVVASLVEWREHDDDGLICGREPPKI